MAAPKGEHDPNESLEANVERTLKEGQLRRVEEESRETPKRRKSPFAAMSRLPRKELSPRPTPSQIPATRFGEPPEFDQYQPRSRYTEPRKFIEESEKPHNQREEPESEVNGENCCISVTIAVVTLLALVVIFAYSFLATKEVK